MFQTTVNNSKKKDAQLNVNFYINLLTTTQIESYSKVNNNIINANNDDWSYKTAVRTNQKMENGGCNESLKHQNILIVM